MQATKTPEPLTATVSATDPHISYFLFHAKALSPLRPVFPDGTELTVLVDDKDGEVAMVKIENPVIFPTGYPYRGEATAYLDAASLRKFASALVAAAVHLETIGGK
jgi:hypothetical protein